jgi:hypothetical protein
MERLRSGLLSFTDRNRRDKSVLATLTDTATILANLVFVADDIGAESGALTLLYPELHSNINPHAKGGCTVHRRPGILPPCYKFR